MQGKQENVLQYKVTPFFKNLYLDSLEGINGLV